MFSYFLDSKDFHHAIAEASSGFVVLVDEFSTLFEVRHGGRSQSSPGHGATKIMKVEDGEYQWWCYE